MLIACAIHPTDLAGRIPDLLILPEGTTERVFAAAKVLLSDDALIVTAMPDGKYMRAVLFHRGTNQINYLKILSDGRSVGSGDLAALPVYELPDLFVAMVVCRDIENPGLISKVLGRARASQARLKILCIPADMGSEWFTQELISGYSGVFVAVSNNALTYKEIRCQSFIADPAGARIVTQRKREAVFAEIP